MSIFFVIFAITGVIIKTLANPDDINKLLYGCTNPKNGFPSGTNGTGELHARIICVSVFVGFFCGGGAVVVSNEKKDKNEKTEKPKKEGDAIANTGNKNKGNTEKNNKNNKNEDDDEEDEDEDEEITLSKIKESPTGGKTAATSPAETPVPEVAEQKEKEGKEEGEEEKNSPQCEAKETMYVCQVTAGCAWCAAEGKCLRSPGGVCKTCEAYVQADECAQRPGCAWDAVRGACGAKVRVSANAAAADAAGGGGGGGGGRKAIDPTQYYVEYNPEGSGSRVTVVLIAGAVISALVMAVVKVIKHLTRNSGGSDSGGNGNGEQGTYTPIRVRGAKKDI